LAKHIKGLANSLPEISMNFVSTKQTYIMKFILTGSLGHISKPLAELLIDAGHSVTVISSNPAKQGDIEKSGANAAIGSVDDEPFLVRVFTGADAVYTMLPPFPFEKNPYLDARAEAVRLTTVYANAIKASGVKMVVHLSSIGAHTDRGNGLLAFHYMAEQTLNRLPGDVSITFMRPVGFYYNLFQFMDIVKGQGFLKGFVGLIMTLKYYGIMGLLQDRKGLIISNYGGDDTMPWVSPLDIAAATAEELQTANGRKFRYVASDVLSCNQIAATLGAAVRKPWLKWGAITDKQMKDALLKFKIPESLADDIVQMNAGMRKGGGLYDDYYKHEPRLGKVKMTDFAKEFASVYYSKS
jgi:nucleoside-diphosphate-sugar epimerase